jgi:hypothetical protein
MTEQYTFTNKLNFIILRAAVMHLWTNSEINLVTCLLVLVLEGNSNDDTNSLHYVLVLVLLNGI